MLKSSILSSTRSQLDDTFWGVVSAAAEGQSRRKADMVTQGDGKLGHWGRLLSPPQKKKKYDQYHSPLCPYFFAAPSNKSPQCSTLLQTTDPRTSGCSSQSSQQKVLWPLSSNWSLLWPSSHGIQFKPTNGCVSREKRTAYGLTVLKG